MRCTVAAVDPRARFAELLREPTVPLARAALCIAQCARPDADVDGALAELDRLAAGVTAGDLAGLVDALFVDAGFCGDREHYDDPRNSMLDSVLLRRRGIPITLAVVMIEVGARCGVDLLPIGMPGHFIVRAANDPAVFCDPFRGELLDEAGCARIFAAMFGSQRALRAAELRPVPATAVLARMLNNLEAGPLGRDLGALGWMVDLHRAIPGLGAGDRVALATRLELLGRFADAAEEIEFAVADVDDAVGARLGARARLYRSRRN